MNIKDETTLVLAFRLNEILKEINEIEIQKLGMQKRIIELQKEWDEIVLELWNRIPSLKESQDLQPKTRKLVKPNE